MDMSTDSAALLLLTEERQRRAASDAQAQQLGLAVEQLQARVRDLEEAERGLRAQLEDRPVRDAGYTATEAGPTLPACEHFVPSGTASAPDQISKVEPDSSSSSSGPLAAATDTCEIEQAS